MKKLNALDWIAIVITIIAAINWGLVGFFRFDLISSLFGDMSGLSRTIYAIIGLAGLYYIFVAPALAKK
ncbi:MAG: DUF378 domain-containing protein [Patescibacteria group bacterium]